MIDFYSLPKEQVKPQGKLAKAPFEDFDMTLYKEKALYTGFKTSPARLPFWILACYKVIYDDFGKNDNYFIDWNDKHDDVNNEFDHIMCKFYDGPVPDETKLKVILRIHFKSSCLTLQGLHYLWFISDVYPTIKDIFESLLGEHNPDPGDSTLLSNCLDPSTKNIPEKLPLTRTTQSHIPLPGTPTTPRKTYSSSIISPPKIDPKQIANIESKTIETFQVIEKYDLENLLKNLDKNQREVNKRLENLEKILPESVKDNNKETVKDASSLIAKLDSIESMISSIPASSSTKNDSSYKDNQIDLLISEISSKNKEIERLKKSNSTLLQKQRDMEKLSNYENDLNNCISILEEKKAEIKEIQLVRKELEAENKRLRERLEENFELEKELSILRQELETSKHMYSTLDNELLIDKRNLETLEIDFDRHSAIIQDKNTIIHNLLLTKDQKNQPFTSDSNLTTGSEYPEEKNQSSTRKKILLIGDSLIKHIIPEHLLPQRFNFEVLVEKAYHMEEIPNVINSFDNFTDISTLVIHCGTNDIQSVPVDILIN